MSKKLRYVPMPSNRIGRDEPELTPSSPEWHPDNLNKTCELCENGFTVFNRRHHCRNCGRVVCGKCLIKYSRSSESHFIPVCKLCFNCAIYGNKDDDTCVDYMRESNLAYTQFIAKDFSIDGAPVTEGSILTIKRGLHNPRTREIFKARVDDLKDISPKTGFYTDVKDDGGIKLTITEIVENATFNLKVGQQIYLVNLPEGSEDLNESAPSRIISKCTYTNFHNGTQSTTTDGFALVTDVSKDEISYPASGGYKHRKNKSKRSVRRRVSKRSNVRCKKVTKRLRKMRRRMRR